MPEWKIIDGADPFQDDFPLIVDEIDDVPYSFWKIDDGDLPFLNSFRAEMVDYIDDVPISMWKIIDGDLPFLTLYRPVPKRPHKEKRYKGKHSKIIIPIYKQTIPVGNVLRSDPPG